MLVSSCSAFMYTSSRLHMLPLIISLAWCRLLNESSVYFAFRCLFPLSYTVIDSILYKSCFLLKQITEKEAHVQDVAVVIDWWWKLRKGETEMDMNLIL